MRFDGVTFGAASYKWDFGDQTAATTTQPLAFHRYQQAGVYNVTLTVTEGDGSSAQATIPVDVVALPDGARLPSIAGPSARSRKDPGYSRVASHEAASARTVLCWNAADWAILAKAFDESGVGGYVDPAKPRQIGLAPTVCSRLDLVRYRKPSAPATTKTAIAVYTLAREIQQSRGYTNQAQTSCYGLQMVPDTAALLGATPANAEKLGRLAATWFRRPNLPLGSWSPQCRDGGKLDLDPTAKHWP